MKKAILSNAHALFGRDYPSASHFDVLTCSSTPTGRLDSQVWRASLVVYTSKESREWKMLYKSNVCETREDALFELLYWVEEDMEGVVRGMEVTDVMRGDDGKKSEEKDDGKFRGREDEGRKTVDDNGEVFKDEGGGCETGWDRKRVGEELISGQEGKRVRF
ncbi:hypothetical protein N0V90_004074 [Kalmusia sp. IMI 367209]|nr:hypothetical protein N0V90_004074 [Kalmusia sp. IMI 367209]